ncbi:NAD(+) synthase [candidate division GN15 bacterium]|uniref:NH(3)-dependent NAD(+) synthetase n=1 Tax=candidate division GN15 bacterium TaxID=2072418 RepID=A0A855XCP5_9BACT|nr:MAG: NAD(+) synthase [candidate division GN15 bacterium]
MEFTKDSLKIDAAAVTEQLCQTIRTQIRTRLHKTGAVVGVSGGIDSTVCAALCARALGPERVVGIMMPEKDSSPLSEQLARKLAAQFGFQAIKEDISGGLAGLGCYERRDEAIRSVFPEFDPSWSAKITIPTNILEKDTFNFFHLTIENKSGESRTKRMPLAAYLQVVASSNLKQRLRMTTLYYHAEKRNWAVIGTGNKDEHEQGFFVKYGDGGADLKPIAHLFKIQVYQLAEYLKVPREIIDRTPTTDTYSAEVTQEEFFFGLDFYKMDMLWYALEHKVPAEKAAEVLGLTVEQVRHGYANIERKVNATEYLKLPPLHAV